MKRSLTLVLALATCLALSGCSGLSNPLQRSVYGDDQRIAQRYDTFTALDYRGSALGEISVGSLTGSDTLLHLSVPKQGGTVSLDYDANVKSGKFKLVLAKLDERVDVVCEGSDRGERTLDLEAGNYAVKIVGIDARVSLSIQIKATRGIAAALPHDDFDEGAPIQLEPLEAPAPRA